MTSSVFPDINVWLALTSSGHFQHSQARRWFEALDESSEIFFCRHSQMGLLRLLTTASVMGAEVKTQRQAWRLYDAYIESGSAKLAKEPEALEEVFRAHSRLSSASPKDWGDSYLVAFSQTAGLRLVTFDRSLASRVRGALLLEP